jgi:diadenosine tetraphosphate (Ap4A) HIT family hydrolase
MENQPNLTYLESRLKQRRAVAKMHDDELTLSEAQQAGIAPWTNVVREDFHITVFADAYAVTPGHLLFVPQHNTDTLISQAFQDALAEGRRMVLAGECDAFNIGLNMGRPAGQTVLWPHVHLIPRRIGDTADPVGGVRNVIPFAGNYKRKVGWLKKILRRLAQ